MGLNRNIVAVVAALAAVAIRAGVAYADEESTEEPFYNAVRPDFAANWQLRAQVRLLFPK